MDCDQNVIFLWCNFLFFSVVAMFMVFYIAFFSFVMKLMHIVFIQPLWYCTIMSGRILEVSMTLTLNDTRAFTYLLMFPVDFEILDNFLEKSWAYQKSLALCKLYWKCKSYVQTQFLILAARTYTCGLQLLHVRCCIKKKSKSKRLVAFLLLQLMDIRKPVQKMVQQIVHEWHKWRNFLPE